MFQTTKTGIRLHAKEFFAPTASQIRIGRDGVVRAYGPAPNAAHKVCWYDVASVADILADIHRRVRDADPAAADDAAWRAGNA